MIDWAHLPFEGGLLEQPRALMLDLTTAQWQYEIIKAMRAADKAEGQAGGGR